MKKILNGPTVWRAKCPYCDCEFEYDYSEVDSHTFPIVNWLNAHVAIGIFIIKTMLNLLQKRKERIL